MNAPETAAVGRKADGQFYKSKLNSHSVLPCEHLLNGSLWVSSKSSPSGSPCGEALALFSETSEVPQLRNNS